MAVLQSKNTKTAEKPIMDLPELKVGEKYKVNGIYNHVARKLSKTNEKRLDDICKHGGRTKVSKEL